VNGVSRKDGRVMGAILLVLGAVALFEGQRLFALRTQMVAGAVVGDDTLPVLVGLAFIVLGGYFLLLFRLPASSVSFPKGPVRRPLRRSWRPRRCASGRRSTLA
jgi:hypothetical protein